MPVPKGFFLSSKLMPTIAAFLFLAGVVAQTVIFDQLAVFLQAYISEPRMLLLAMPLMNLLISGLFSAGPASAAAIAMTATALIV